MPALLAAVAALLPGLLPDVLRGRQQQQPAATVWRRPHARTAAPPAMQLGFDELGESWTEEGGSSVGVLLLSVGSPETPDDVEVRAAARRKLAR